MYELIEHLKNKQWLWQGSQCEAKGSSSSTGYHELDEHLTGGFPEFGVVEIHSPIGIGELRLLLPHIQHNQGERLMVFIQPPGQVCAEFLVHHKLNPRLTLILHPENEQQALWAAEQCLKSGACSHVLLWNSELEIHQARRLQVASETGQALHFVFASQSQSLFSLPVSLSLSLQPHQFGLQAQIRKRKGGWKRGQFTIDMRSLWPSLCLEPKTIEPDLELDHSTPIHAGFSNVVSFPMRKQG